MPGPPSGGFPQQGGQYPGMPGYPQQAQYGPMDPNQYGQMGGFPPQEPKKSKTGLWVGIGIAVVAVVAFVITAFVVPGFLLSDDDDSESTSGDSGTSAGGEQGGDGGPGALAQQIADALTSGDSATLQNLLCADATEMVNEAVGMAGSLGQVQMTGEPQVQGDQAAVLGTAGEYKVAALLKDSGNGWCWQDVQIDTSGAGGDIGAPAPGDTGSTGDTGDTGSTGSGSPSDLSSEGQQFLDKVMSTLDKGDSAALPGMVCEGWEDALEDLKTKASSSETLEIEEVELIDFGGGAEGFTATMTSDTGGLIVSAENTTGTYCIFSAAGY
ncbi:hypothetical protein [Saccharomonospora azurea]|uniref:hypothetical protein n=1 Tax=Saccharomonospora azurea TaxID=40988 RepID=UPI0003187578|nr:hypothetical protein [Saccharomonospora azurea]